MKILIIGCGYLGRVCAHKLRAKGHTITGTFRSLEKKNELDSLLDRTVLWDNEHWLQAFEDQDAVLLCAAAKMPSDYETAYLDNAHKIVAAAAKFPQLQQILYTSSTSVYGDHQGALVDENTPLHPNNPQIKILLETEKALLSLTHPKAAILRLGELIGVGRTIEQRLLKMSLLPGTGENFCNLSPLSDVVRSLEFVLSNGLNGVFNVVTPYHPTRKELYEKIAKERRLQLPPFNLSCAPIHGGNKLVASTKLEKTGFQFKASSSEGLW